MAKYVTIYARLPEAVYRRFIAYQASKGFVSSAQTITNLLTAAEIIETMKRKQANESPTGQSK